jgi:hypothetical protein
LLPDGCGFFRASSDPEDILRRYFELARWWRDLNHIMNLPLSRMALYYAEATRLADAEAAALRKS